MSAGNTPASEHEGAFVAYLMGLVKRPDRAALAALRRGLGKTPGEAIEMYPYVMRFVTDTMPRWRQLDFFLVAALFAAHQLSWVAPSGDMSASNLGASFRRLRLQVGRASIDKRFAALLAAERSELPQHLRFAVSLLKAHEIPIDWSRLLHDLRGWDWDSRSIQRAWAQAYWQISEPR